MELVTHPGNDGTLSTSSFGGFSIENRRQVGIQNPGFLRTGPPSFHWNLKRFPVSAWNMRISAWAAGNASRVVNRIRAKLHSCRLAVLDLDQIACRTTCDSSDSWGPPH